jgi:glycosyltransferase involved in cell wall biosynthesis
LLGASEYRALLRRARVFVCAPRREDYGISQLEALADGCLLVTTPAPGPYAALEIARDLDPRLVDEDLSSALFAALEQPPEGYCTAARAPLTQFGRDAVDRVVADELLPRLLSPSPI